MRKLLNLVNKYSMEILIVIFTIQMLALQISVCYGLYK